MPIANIQDAREVDDLLNAALDAAETDQRIGAMRRLFVEILDYELDNRPISLGASLDPALPDDAYLIAHRDGVNVIYTPVSDNRVTGRAATTVARSLRDLLSDDLLLLFTNESGDQLHIIHPSFAGARPTLKRMVVRRGEHRRTVVQQIANMWNDYGRLDKSVHEAIREAFSVEPVTKAFFRAYRDIFQESETKILGFGSGPGGHEACRLFTQTMFNRLMFVYFLSRKGWLLFNGDTDYLNALWKDYQSGSDDNFYNDRLAPLFFAGLNNQQSRDLNQNNQTLHTLIGDVPFLNGGLFERNDLDRRGISVPDDAIESILRGLFDQFNFTVMESTLYDTEVAVDPEMLGKVFEELVTGRNESGAYYTPRPVVAFMCREALKGYLEGQDTGLSSDAIARFIDDRDTSGIPVAAAHGVSQALDNVTVVDPACGSGAYLLGMMQELVDLQTALYSEQLRASARDLYRLKLHIIERNLYGVDIDDFAVNIAMLRLWLSLVIEYEGDHPAPLPNLDFKIVRGDSLLGPDPSAGVMVQGTLGYDAEEVQRLGRLKADFMQASLGSDKERLRQKIREAADGVREALGDIGVVQGVIDWRVEFAEVFARKRGFDIALANPPYIQLQKDGGKLADLYKSAGFETFVRTGDIYQLFFERGCQLLRPSYGLLAYITSNSWLRAEYGKGLRRFFSENHTPMSLLDLGKDVFDSAIVDSSVLLLRTGSANGAFRAVDMDSVPNSDFPPEEGQWGQIRPSGEVPWSILSPLEKSVMDKMIAKGTPLKAWAISIYRGVTTGYNKAFIIDTSTRKSLIDQDQNSAEIIKPMLRGRDIQRYRAKWAGQWLIFVPWHFPLHMDKSIKGCSSRAEEVFQERYPAIYRHLLSHKTALAARNKSETGIRYEWYALQRWAASYHAEFAKEKLFWMQMSGSGRFSFAEGGIYSNQKAFMITGNSLKYLCGVLNSTLSTWFMKSTGVTTGMGLVQWDKFSVQRIPIPRISDADQRPFIQLVDEIIEAKAADPNADTSHLEWEIDRLVYDLYGLTEEEDTAIERSLGLIHATDEEEDAAILKWMLEAKSDDPQDFVSEEVVMATLRELDGD